MNDGKKSGRRPRFYEGNSPASLHISAWARSVRLAAASLRLTVEGCTPSSRAIAGMLRPPKK